MRFGDVGSTLLDLTGRYRYRYFDVGRVRFESVAMLGPHCWI